MIALLPNGAAIDTAAECSGTM